MDAQNSLGDNRIYNHFMQEFSQCYCNMDAKMQSAIAECFRRNIGNMAQFTLELQTLSISQEVKSNLLAIYGRCMSGSGTLMQERLPLLAPGKRSGGFLEGNSKKRPCIQPTLSHFEKNIPTIKEWIQKGDVNFIEKSFALVGGYANAADEQLIEVCNALVELLKNESWSGFNSATLSAEIFTPWLALLQVDNIRVVLAASACLAEHSGIKTFNGALQTSENTETHITMLEGAMGIYLNEMTFSTSSLSTCLQKFAEQPDMARALLINLCRIFPSCKKDKLECERFVKIVENLFALLKSAHVEVVAQAAICLARLSLQLRDQFENKPLNIAERCFEFLLHALESGNSTIVSAGLASLGRLIWHKKIWQELQAKHMPKIFSFASHPDDQIVLSLVDLKNGFLPALTALRSQKELSFLKDWVEPLLPCLSHANLAIVEHVCWMLGEFAQKDLIDPQPLFVQKLFGRVFDTVKTYTFACREAAESDVKNPSRLSSALCQLEQIALFGCRCIGFLKKHLTIDQAEKMLQLWLECEGFPFSTKMAVLFLAYLGGVVVADKAWDQYAVSFHERCLPLFFKKFSSPDPEVVEVVAMAAWGLEQLLQNPTTAKQITAQLDWVYALKLLDHSSAQVAERSVSLLSRMIAAQKQVNEIGERFIKKCLEKIDGAGSRLQLFICRAFNTSIKLPGWSVEDAFRVREKILIRLQCEETPASLLFQETAFWCLGNMLLKPEFRQSTDLKEMWPLIQKVFSLRHDQASNAELDKAVEGACFCFCNLMENCSEAECLELLWLIVDNQHPKIIETCLWRLNYMMTKLSLNKEELAVKINCQFIHFIVNQLSSTNEKIMKGALWCTSVIVLFKVEQKFLYPEDFLSFILEKVGDILQRSKDVTLARLAISVMKTFAEISPSFAERVLERISHAKRTIAGLMKSSTIHELGLIAALSSLQAVKNQLNASVLIDLLKVLRNDSSIPMHPSALIILKSFQPAPLQNDRDAIIELGSKFLMSNFAEGQPEKANLEITTLQSGDASSTKLTLKPLTANKEAIEKERREAAIAFLADYVPQGNCNLPIEVLSEKANFLLTCLQTGDSSHLVETARLLVSFVLAGAVNIADPQLELSLLMHPQPEIGKEVLPLLEMLFKNDPASIFPLLSRFKTFKVLCSFPPSPYQEKVQSLVQADNNLVAYWEEKALHAEGTEYQPLLLWLYPSKEEGLQRLGAHLKKTPSLNFFLNALQLCSQLNLGSESLGPHSPLKSMPFLQHGMASSKTYAEFYSNENFKDFSLKVGAVTIRCHKIILAQYPYFQAVLLKDPQGPSKAEIDLGKEDASIFKQVVEFMYLKQLYVSSPEQVLSCLKVAQKYLIEDLELFCISILKDLLHPETFSQIFDLACSISCETLVDYAIDWLLINYARFSHEQRLEIAARWENLGEA